MLISAAKGACPNLLPEHGCSHVSTWIELRNAIESASNDVCFDGFDIKKNETDKSIVVHGYNISISCQRKAQCRVFGEIVRFDLFHSITCRYFLFSILYNIFSGAGHHLSIVGHGSDITISGFTFEGATNAAVIVDSRRGHQYICGCEFVRWGIITFFIFEL